MPTKTFWCEATEECQFYLRRYAGAPLTCPGEMSYHNATVPWYRGARVASTSHPRYDSAPQLPDKQEPLWPKACSCGYAFVDGDSWQVWPDRLYRRSDTGEIVPMRELPVGAMWDSWWGPDRWRGADGIALTVRLHGNHDWMVDAQASNCTRPGEPHKCWVRHGDPRTGDVHVDKNGDTCSAGAGSIAIPGYHGFLHNGYLTDG